MKPFQHKTAYTIKMKHSLISIFTVTLALASSQAATLISTEFNISDGFVTGDFGDVTLDGAVTFSDGQQQQMENTAFYNNGPAAYLFINGGGGLDGLSSTGDTGLISFAGLGATTVSFHAANLANGPATTFTSFDALGNTLETFVTTVSTLNGNLNDAGEVLTFTAVGNVNIASIEVNLPGPASPVNPPYAASIDTFSATVVGVPEPSSAALIVAAMGIGFARRRR